MNPELRIPASQHDQQPVVNVSAAYSNEYQALALLYCQSVDKCFATWKIFYSFYFIAFHFYFCFIEKEETLLAPVVVWAMLAMLVCPKETY